MIELLKLISGEEIICIRVDRSDEHLFTLHQPYLLKDGEVYGRFLRSVKAHANREVPFPRSGVFFMVEEADIKESVKAAYLTFVQVEDKIHAAG